MMDGISNFALSISLVAGATSDRHNEAVKYMLERGVPQDEIDEFYKAACKLARAFYRKPGDKDAE